jgi:hypothetical protein
VSLLFCRECNKRARVLWLDLVKYGAGLLKHLALILESQHLYYLCLEPRSQVIDRISCLQETRAQNLLEYQHGTFQAPLIWQGSVIFPLQQYFSLSQTLTRAKSLSQSWTAAVRVPLGARSVEGILIPGVHGLLADVGGSATCAITKLKV